MDIDGIFLPRPDLEVGQELDLEIAFADSGVVFEGPGVVLWRRLSWSKLIRPGIGIEFAPRDPGKRTMLFRFVEGRAPRPLVARPRRVACEIAVEYVTDGQCRRWTTISDLSGGGALIRHADDLVPGAAVHLHLHRTGAKPIRMEAVVAWRRMGIGAGVRFVKVDTAEGLWGGVER